MEESEKQVSVSRVPLNAGLCPCRKCGRERNDGETIEGTFMPRELLMMILCPKCGNKRCPHAMDHLNKCTRSNAINQKGSFYE